MSAFSTGSDWIFPWNIWCRALWSVVDVHCHGFSQQWNIFRTLAFSIQQFRISGLMNVVVKRNPRTASSVRPVFPGDLIGSLWGGWYGGCSFGSIIKLSYSLGLCGYQPVLKVSVDKHELIKSQIEKLDSPLSEITSSASWFGSCQMVCLAEPSYGTCWKMLDLEPSWRLEANLVEVLAASIASARSV